MIRIVFLFFKSDSNRMGGYGNRDVYEIEMINSDLVSVENKIWVR
jgi:hypothetical protein